MDFQKNRSFIKTLVYDLDTVQYLLDYGRLKETVPIIDKILDNINSFTSSNSGNNLKCIFTEDFWKRKLPVNMSLSEMRANLNKLSHSQSPYIENELNKIEYSIFVKNIFKWSDENISRLRQKTKSPLHQKIEKIIFYLFIIILGVSLVIIPIYSCLTWDWGLKGDFYQGEDFEQYLYSGYKKTINFSTPEEMDSRLPSEHFSARWKGKLLVPKDGEYTIFTNSDDGDRIFIDGKLLFADWSTHMARESSKSIFLSKGTHLITLEYFQGYLWAILQLSWSIDGGKKEIIPAQYLRH